MVSQSQTVDAAASVHAKIRAPRGETSPVTSGRLTVRCMCASMSRSRYMLKAAAEPALIDPPRTVASTSQMFGKAALREDHHRDGGHQQQLEHARLGERDVRADRAAEGMRSSLGGGGCCARRHRGVHRSPICELLGSLDILPSESTGTEP